MKRLILSFLLLLFITFQNLYSQSGWFWQNPKPQGNILNSVKFIDGLTGIAVGESGTILLSTNSGLNWNNMIFNSGLIPYESFFINSNTGFVTAYEYNLGSYLLRTTDAGITWNGTGLITSNIINSIYFSDLNTGYLLGNYGTVIKTTNGGGNFVGINSSSAEVPQSFSLSQNYPNPFNPVTRIKYSLPNPSKGGAERMKLIIYDMLGREIETLVNENKKPGTYEVDWDGTNYPSGIYFCRLYTDEYVATRKMVLTK